MFRRIVRVLNYTAHSALEDPIRRFQLSLLTIVLLTVFATGGYMFLEQMNVTDALYMTVITITTVGFGEVQTLSPVGRVFTIFIILLGVSAATTAISNAVGIVLGPRLWNSIRLRNMERQLQTIKNHYIVCGYGRMGRQVVGDLMDRGEPFVLIDTNEDLPETLIEAGILHVTGNATQDDTLLAAGIERAKGLVAALDTDPDNVMTVLTARELNPKLFIVARVSKSEAESKLRRAGANKVISPYQIGGHRIALALLRPAVNDFLDSIFYFQRGINIDIGQIEVLPESALADTTVATCGLRDKYRVNVLAIRHPDGEMVITPQPSDKLHPGATVIIIGPPEHIYDLEKMYRAER